MHADSQLACLLRQLDTASGYARFLYAAGRPLKA
jgi:hypothetical protein